MKKPAFLTLIAVLLFTLACTIGYEGIGIGDDPDIDHIYELTETAAARNPNDPLTSGFNPSDYANQVTEEPVSPVDTSSSTTSYASTPSGDQVEYAVSASNNGCVCQVSGNMTLALDIQEDKLFYNLPDGTSHEYAKISENSFKRTYMGYYILVDTSGGQEVETRVDEERHDVIILTRDGFISEHYQGNESSPCCYHTFTVVDETP